MVTEMVLVTEKPLLSVNTTVKLLSLQAQAMMLDDSYSCNVVKPYLVGVFAQYCGLPVFVT